MPNFSCPSCKKVLKLNDGMGGKTVRCPACQTAFVVPKEDPAVVQTSITPAAPIMPNEPASPQAEPEPKWEPDSGGDGERPAKKKGKFSLKLDKKMLIMAGGGAGGLLVLFLLGAFVWPGFWLSGRASAGLRYLSPDSNFVAGINFPSFSSASFKKQIQNMGIAEKGMKDGPPMRELFQDADWVMMGGSEGDDFSMVVQKTRAPDLNAFRRKSKFGPATKTAAEQYKDKTVYYSSKDRTLLFLPNPRLLVMYHAGHSDAPYFPGLSDHDPNRIAPEMDAAVRNLHNNGIWFVMTPEAEFAKMIKGMFLGGKTTLKVKQPPPRPQPPSDDPDSKEAKETKETKEDDFKDARLAFKNCKLITLAANPTSDGKSLKGDLTFECASEGDAQKLEKAFSPQKENFANILAFPLFAPTPKLRENLVKELKDSLEFKVTGSRLVLTMKVGDSVWDGLKTFQEEREKAEKDEE